ncbi:MAG: RecQ family ATP-dependent DNA helicase [Dehalococcoidia bacterium]|nr:RecQ family ATP-dependent DNA helicase [Dehalococcoidia bacterium]
MTCQRCGSPLADDAIFCGSCGTRADGPAPLPGFEAVAVRAAPRSPQRVAPPRPADPATFPDDLEVYRARLQSVFGYPDFRRGQAEVLTHLAARDVLGVMPTGSGKSLCYVLPALEVGRTLVVSPLIALMQDQVEALQSAGVAATFINSSLDRAEQNRRYRDFIEGRTALLFVAPERFANQRFVEGLQAAGVNLFVVDEAHCISEWGHDFRPDYLALGPVRERLGAPRTLALTATADPLVRRDILARLGVAGRADEVLTTFDRPNLHLGVVPVTSDGERLDWLVRYARSHRGQAGIIYARTRRNVEDTAAALSAAGVPALAYHAGMGSADRARIQRRFITGEVPVLVATNAFGMGIDKPDIRYVVHTHLPGRIEAYYQEAGRAGRDGDPAECTLLYARRDAALQRRFIDQAHPDEHELRRIWWRLVELQEYAGDRAIQYGDAVDASASEGLPVALTAFRASGLIEPGALRLTSTDRDAPLDLTPIEERRRYAESRLAQMIEYAETSGCRRALILRYFGEESADRCTNCDNCRGNGIASEPEYPLDLFNDLLDARADLARSSGRPPYLVFEERTAREIATYRPATQDALLEIWGMGETRSRWFGDRLLRLVAAWEAAHADAPRAPARPRARATASATEAEVAYDDPLYQRLRAWRLQRAREDGVPAYTLFSDRTARELASRRPSDEDALRSVWGMGDARVREFGRDLLAVITAED